MASLSAVDGPQCVTPTLYAQTQVDEWRHHLESEGYVVIRDMFDPDERVAMIRQFWSDFEQSCLLLSNASAHDDADAATGTTHAAAAAMPPPVSNDRKSIKGKKASKKAARVKVQHVDYNKRAADRKQQSAKAPPEAYARFDRHDRATWEAIHTRGRDEAHAPLHMAQVSRALQEEEFKSIDLNRLLINNYH